MAAKTLQVPKLPSFEKFTCAFYLFAMISYAFYLAVKESFGNLILNIKVILLRKQNFHLFFRIKKVCTTL